MACQNNLNLFPTAKPIKMNLYRYPDWDKVHLCLGLSAQIICLWGKFHDEDQTRLS